MDCDVVAEGGSANYCLDRTGKRDRIACVGSQIGAVPKYLTITPFYFKLDGTDKVGRMSEANWCQPNSQNVAAYKTPAYSHQLRCVKDDSAGAIKKPDNLTPIPVTIKCAGIGCYRRQGI